MGTQLPPVQFGTRCAHIKHRKVIAQLFMSSSRFFVEAQHLPNTIHVQVTRMPEHVKVQAVIPVLIF